MARGIFREAADAERVVVNFTGGTKVLSAAAVHAALTEPLGGELVLDDTGGAVREPQTGRVLREAMRVVRSERTATDSVLRSYRAVEVAAPARRLQSGVNPWRPQWEKVEADVMRCCRALLNATQPPYNLALSTGLTFLEAMGQTLSEDGRKRLTDVQQLRNFSYLEHGYQRLSADDARRVNDYASALCAELLGDALDALRASVRHAW